MCIRKMLFNVLKGFKYTRFKLNVRYVSNLQTKQPGKVNYKKLNKYNLISNYCLGFQFLIAYHRILLFAKNLLTVTRS